MTINTPLTDHPLEDRALTPESAACTVDPPTWDAEREAGERRATRKRRIARAIKTCGTCPVINACAAAVQREEIPEGVWAGVLYLAGEPQEEPK